MAIAKVVLNGTTQMDTTQVTVTANTLAQGVTALGADGTLVTGTSAAGDYTAEDFGDPTKPVGDITYLGSYIGTQNNQGSPAYFSYRTAITKLYMPNYNNTGNAASGPFRNNTAMVYAIMPKMTKVYNAAFYGCSSLKALDWLGGEINGSSNHFVACTKLNTMVIRKTASICSLATINAFNNTPFADGKAGGTLYVPQDLIASYQAATNWSTILGYTNNQIKSIESTATDPNAPVDLTTHYIDGTPIPTA